MATNFSRQKASTRQSARRARPPVVGQTDHGTPRPAVRIPGPDTPLPSAPYPRCCELTIRGDPPANVNRRPDRRRTFIAAREGLLWLLASKVRTDSLVSPFGPRRRIRSAKTALCCAANDVRMVVRDPKMNLGNIEHATFDRAHLTPAMARVRSRFTPLPVELVNTPYRISGEIGRASCREKV